MWAVAPLSRWIRMLLLPMNRLPSPRWNRYWVDAPPSIVTVTVTGAIAETSSVTVGGRTGMDAPLDGRPVGGGADLDRDSRPAAASMARASAATPSRNRQLRRGRGMCRTWGCWRVGPPGGPDTGLGSFGRCKPNSRL